MEVIDSGKLIYTDEISDGVTEDGINKYIRKYIYGDWGLCLIPNPH